MLMRAGGSEAAGCFVVPLVGAAAAATAVGFEGCHDGEGVLVECKSVAAALPAPPAVGVFVCAYGGDGADVFVAALVGAAEAATSVEFAGCQGGERVASECKGAAAALATPPAVGAFVCACGVAGTGVLLFALVEAAALAKAVKFESDKGGEGVPVE